MRAPRPESSRIMCCLHKTNPWACKPTFSCAIRRCPLLRSTSTRSLCISTNHNTSSRGLTSDYKKVRCTHRPSGPPLRKWSKAQTSPCLCSNAHTEPFPRGAKELTWSMAVNKVCVCMTWHDGSANSKTAPSPVLAMYPLLPSRTASCPNLHVCISSNHHRFKMVRLLCMTN